MKEKEQPKHQIHYMPDAMRKTAGLFHGVSKTRVLNASASLSHSLRSYNNWVFMNPARIQKTNSIYFYIAEGTHIQLLTKVRKVSGL